MDDMQQQASFDAEYAKAVEEARDIVESYTSRHWTLEQHAALDAASDALTELMTVMGWKDPDE